MGEGAAEIRRTQGTPLAQRSRIEAAHGAAVHVFHALIEGADQQRTLRRCLGQLGQQRRQQGHVFGHLQRPRGAGVNEHDESAVADVVGGCKHGSRSDDDDVFAAQRLRSLHLDTGIDVGHKALLFQVQQHLAVAVAHPHPQVLDLWQTDQRQDVRRRRRRQHVSVADDQFFATPGGDGKDAGLKLVAGGLFEQGRVLAAVQKIFVGAAGGLLLDDLGLLQTFVNLHGEARHRRTRRQGDLKLPLDHPIFGVFKREPQLGEAHRPAAHGVSVQRYELESGAV